jgi:hypothetical protein
MGIAVYVGDARSQALPLVSPFPGEIVHDWNYLLGTLGLLESDAIIARLVRTMGYASLLASVLLGGWMLLVMSTDPVRRRNRTRRGDPGQGGARADQRPGAQADVVGVRGSGPSRDQTRPNRGPPPGRRERVSQAPEGEEQKSRPRVPPPHTEEDGRFARWWAHQTGSGERRSPSNPSSGEETEIPLLPDDLVSRAFREIPERPGDRHTAENESTRARSASIQLLEERARKGELSPTELRFLHWLRRQR